MALLMTAIRSFILLALLVSLAGCAGYATSGELRTRAARDMQCDESQVNVQQVDGQTMSAIGCGQQRDYFQQCDGAPDAYPQDCKWIAK
jgi:hypothetical protein